MKNRSRRLIAHGAIACVPLIVLLCLAALPALAAQPAQPAPVAPPDTTDVLLTPQAQIQLGIGRCDTELMMRRAGVSSATYPLRSLWRGIVEYLLPDYGLFKRGDLLARIYDPALLPDLEHAREMMSVTDVNPLTIAPPEKPSDEVTADEAEPGQAGVPARDSADAQAQGTPAGDRQAPPSLRVQPANPSSAAVGTEPPTATVSGATANLKANAREQRALRQQAQETARAVAAAIETRNKAEAARDKAQKELEDRQRLFESGVLAEQALQPALERETAAIAVLAVAEAELHRQQDAYAQIARRIRALEREAAAAAEPTKQAAAPAAAPEAGTPAPPTEQTDTPQAPTTQETRDDPWEPGQPLPLASEVKDLAAPRWQELTAPASGLVADVVAPSGALVDEGQELLELANVQLAKLTAHVHQRDLPGFQTGRSVSITFADYPSVVLEGWVAAARPAEGSDDAEVELLVLCSSGPFADDAYLAVEWMVLEGGLAGQDMMPTPVEPVREPSPAGYVQKRLQSLIPLTGPRELVETQAAKPEDTRSDCYAGRLRLLPMPRLQGLPEHNSARDAERLAALREWRSTYIEGMVTTILDDGTAITYPREGEVATAVRRMLEGRVSHARNRCARTMRESLGWGLGDAHVWAHRLPHMGYEVRQDGLPRPGDMLVWPFTYGPGRSEHIGVAVRQGRRLMLLSNLGGRLGTSEILGGYLAFTRADQGSKAR